MTNLDKIGKDNAKLMLETFSFLGEDKIGFIKNTKMFKFLNNDYEKTYKKDIYETVQLKEPKLVRERYGSNCYQYKRVNTEQVKIGEKEVTYKSKVRYDKTKEYLDHSKIIIPIELNTLLVCNVIDEDQHKKLTDMAKSNDLEMVKLAESIVFEKRQQKLKSKIYKCLKTTKKEIQ
jgi:hypothetical protein